MSDPLRLVYVNIIALLSLITFFSTYRFIFPKKTIPFVVLLLFISLLLCTSLLRTGAFESGDFNIHLYRSIAFYDALKEGVFMPSWAKDLNATYGYPLFIFNYPLPYYIICFFHWIGFSFIASMKLFLGANIVFSGIGMYFLSKKLFNSSLASFTASIFYLFAPYHLIDIHFKGAIGEVLFFTLLPLSFLCMYNLYNKNSPFSQITAGIAFAFLILSHVAIALFTAAFFLCYFIFISWKKQKKVPFYMLFAFVLAAIISMYSWITPFILSQYTFLTKMTVGTVYFPTISDLLFSPWRLGFLFQGPQGEISYVIGYIHIFVVGVALFFSIMKPTKVNDNQLFWLLSFFVFLFLILPFSKFVWELLPLIKTVGSHRLLILLVFCNSIIAGSITLYIKKKTIIYLLVLLAILSTILNWGHRRVIPAINDANLIANVPLSTSHGEAHFYANSKWVEESSPWFSVVPKKHLEIISGKGEITEIKRTSHEHRYRVTAYTPLTLRENTLYFPGWSGKDQEGIIDIYPDNKGIISLHVDKGYHELFVTYKDIPLFYFIKVLSALSFLLSVGFILFSLIRKYVPHQG